MNFKELFENPYKNEYLTVPLSNKQCSILLQRFSYWNIIISHHPFLMFECTFNNFEQVHLFVNQIIIISKKINHHPIISLGWNFCKLTLYTHLTKSLSWSDAYMVFMIDQLIQKNKFITTLSKKNN